MSLSITKVSSSKDTKAFIDFPHELYKDDPNYVPEVYLGMKDLLSEKKNPFFKHSSAHLYLLKREEKIIGRIASVINNNYNNYHSSNVGFFGFFDCINDQTAANMLLDKAKHDLEKSGFESMIGPTNFSTNDTAGLLVDGFDSPPVVMMTYNRPYYVQLLEQYGLTKEMDLLAYKVPTKSVERKSLRIAQLLEERLKRKGISIRLLNMKNFKQEVENIREVYNAAWSDNWGFVPVTKDEFDHMAEGLKMIILPRYTYIAEQDGKAIGFFLAVPNINEIVIKLKKGRVLPFGIFKLLFGKSKTKVVRIVTLGIMEDYRKLGIEGIFYAKVIQAAIDHNIEFGEGSWILENNQMMVQGMEKLNATKYKTYRIYSKTINPS